MKKNFPMLTTILTGVLMLAACAAPATPTPTATPTLPPQPSPVAAIRYHFVTNSLLIPTTSAQASSFGLDIDGDGQPDNLFGQALATLVTLSPGLDLQANANEVVDAGQVVMLHTLQVDDALNDPNALWSVFHGQPGGSAPRFDGSDTFTLDAAAPTNSQVSGSLVNGHFTGGPGIARIQVVVLDIPVQFDLIGVHIEADVSANGCTEGRLAGGVAEDEFRARLLPALADGLDRVVTSDTGCPAACGSLSKTLLQAFDANQDGGISQAEIENNILLKLAISPDLDLLDASGQFNPRQDGKKDSFSVGLGFTCVPAGFTAPGD